MKGWFLPKKTKKDASDPLAWIQTLVRFGDYEVSRHVYDYLEDGDFKLDDIENSILNGKLEKTQNDKKCESVNGKKYTIRGRCRNGLPFETVGKLMESDDGEYYFLITAGKR
ncbi:MAG: DUF4258 domain-containing protein [Phycisphaerae bacterium]|nr:DUF4258 domain-containing protein [Phycisphaerae bacterium]